MLKQLLNNSIKNLSILTFEKLNFLTTGICPSKFKVIKNFVTEIGDKIILEEKWFNTQ